MILAWAFCLASDADTPSPDPALPAPTAMSEPSILLVSWTTPPGWIVTPSPGSMDFVHPSNINHAGSISLVPTSGGLAEIREELSISRATFSDALIAGRPALRVQSGSSSA